ncbi:CynX/NimT family MFS transporter [Microbacterium sp. NPDC091313]
MTRASRSTVLVVVAVVLFAAMLRVAVASLSPVLGYVERDFAVSPAVLGLIGAAPPIAFAVFGILTPMLARRARTEALAVAAAVVSAAGLVARAFAGDDVSLVVTTVIMFAGVGVGNVLMPALIKKYFPSSIALMTTVYVSTLSIGTFIPPVTAVPIADAAGWRLSVGVWAVVAVAAAVPWFVLLRRARRDPLGGTLEEADRAALGRLLRLPRTWALVGMLAVSAGTVYSMFAWLPAIMQERAGVDAATAGVMLGVFGGVGLPVSLVIPALLARYRAAVPLVFASIIPGLVGIAGMVWAPASAPWLWLILLSIPQSYFPFVLTLFGLRTRTHAATIALSGAVQSIGYAVAAVLPITLGALHEATGGWESSLWVLAALFAFGIPAGLAGSRRGTLEEAWERRHGTW